MPGVPFLFQPQDFISQGRQDIHKPTGKDQTSTLDRPHGNTQTHAYKGDETSAAKLKNSPAPTLRQGLPDVCHKPSSTSSPYLPLQKYHSQGEILCDNTHTRTTTGQHIHQGDMGRLFVTLRSLAGNLAAAETRLGRRKSQSAMQKLLVKTHTHHTHTNKTNKHTQPPCCTQSCGMAAEKFRAPPLEMRKIIQGPSFLFNTRRCLYGKPCLDKFGSIRGAEKIK